MMKIQNYFKYWFACSYCGINKNKGCFYCPLNKKSSKRKSYCDCLGVGTHGYNSLYLSNLKEWKEALKEAKLVLNAIKRNIKKEELNAK